MHEALLIAEVFICVLECLAQDTILPPDGPDEGFLPFVSLEDTDGTSNTNTGWGALAALARTCRTLSDPAMDLLWRRLHSLDTIVRCLPGINDDLYRTALPPFSDKDWIILQRYTPRVRELTLGMEAYGSWSENLSLKVLQYLMFSATKLLPNLSQLHWSCNVSTVMVYLRPLLTPTLTHLDISFGDVGDGAVLALLRGYHTLCPNLKSFRVNCQQNQYTDAISQAICQPLNLESIDCDLIDAAAFTHLAQSATLKTLSARLVKQSFDTSEGHRIMTGLARYSSPDLPPFRNVKVIDLHIEDLPFMIPLLRPHHQSFNNISLTFRVVPTTAILHAFFSTLGSTPRRGSVRRIELRQRTTLHRNTHHGHYQPLTYDSLCPLLSFPHLRELVLELDNPVSLNDEELMMLACNWPRLEVLKVNCRSGWRVDSSACPVTLKGLVSLLRLCPMLCELGLSLDARDIPLPSIDLCALQVIAPAWSGAHQGSWGIRNTKITMLYLSDSPLEDPTSVTTFLTEVLASLRKVDAPELPIRRIISRSRSHDHPLSLSRLNTNPLQSPGGASGTNRRLPTPAQLEHYVLWKQVNEHLTERARRQVSMASN
ncbi:hypothetical protein HYDPIDRAFT_115152 [Hydnomerulius pinastri MD-312]|uniref:F-box domain-containing protein n=1 Tax=Hydnomerulius pinastri MD-312 TaxID=994086 RepID=A0A0C9WCC7_9AGAM|nr:hypothetical protein HYDPIDRAFT_115152 [Hydnomerulius pinastri MD-312]